MYIPMFKSRRIEKAAIIQNGAYFSDIIVPMIEILQEHYKQTDFATDDETGEYLKRLKGKRLVRYRVPATDKDEDTLEYYANQLFRNKKAFVDYFRFNPEKYGKGNIKAESVPLSIKLNQDENLYISKLKAVCDYENLIPVLSVKDGFCDSEYGILNVINDLQKLTDEVAVRLDDSAYEVYSESVAPVLRKSDYLMFDICEQNMRSKQIDLEEFNELRTPANKILLNSPRVGKIKNGNFENGFTPLIDNSARDVSVKYDEIVGFGDYCGLKDNLPQNRSFSRGCALALFYFSENNKFMTFVNKDVDKGTLGYKDVIPNILAKRKELDPLGRCPVIREILAMVSEGKSGNWDTWNRLTVSRYISQMAQFLQV